MAVKSDFGLRGVASDVQYGKSGGRVIYRPDTGTFDITLANQTTFANIKADDITSANGDVIINSPTGKVIIAGSSLSLLQDGVFKFDGTGAVAIPTGLMSERPATPAMGMVRINNSANSPYLEYYDGSIWVNTRLTGEAATKGPFDGEPSLTQYTYDSDGIVTSMTETIDGENRIATYTYNNDGAIETIVTTYLGQTRTETFVYNNDGTVNTITAVIT